MKRFGPILFLSLILGLFLLSCGEETSQLPPDGANEEVRANEQAATSEDAATNREPPASEDAPADTVAAGAEDSASLEESPLVPWRAEDDPPARLRFSEGTAEVSGSVLRAERIAPRESGMVWAGRLELDAAATEWMAENDWLIALELVVAPDMPAPIEGYNGSILFEGTPESGLEERVNLVVTPGNTRLYLTQGIVDFAPHNLTLELAEGLGIREVVLSARPYVGYGTVLPAVPADLGLLNFYQTRSWRNPAYELFAWNAVPNVLMLDFADYEVQKRMFGRLGFFVAAVGEVGTVRPYEYYEDMHAYNAQAYKPSDLALFFNTLADEGLVPTDEEAFLRNLLLDYRIMGRNASDRYQAGTGAIISIARETPRPLRQRLLRHEAVHGLFYVSDGYREAIFDIWSDMHPDVVRYYELFLANKGRLDQRQNYDGYNIANTVTLVDEMHAHTIQLRHDVVRAYFNEYYLSVMRSMLSDHAELFDRISSEHRDSFVRVRQLVAEVLARETGISEGLMLGVYPERYGRFR